METRWDNKRAVIARAIARGEFKGTPSSGEKRSETPRNDGGGGHLPVPETDRIGAG